MTERIPRYRLLSSGAVQQTFENDDVSSFDPDTFGEFVHKSGETVRAVKLPGTFIVGAEVCSDGYLIFDGKLKAVSTETFSKDYAPAMTLREVPEVEIA